MTAVKKLYQKSPLLVAYLLIVIAGASAILWQNHLGQVRRHQICYAEIEDRLLVQDIIDQSAIPADKLPPINPSLPPEVQTLIKEGRERAEVFRTFAEKRLEIPPTICDGTGLTKTDVIKDQIRRNQRPNPQLSTTTTSTEVG